MPLFYVQDSDRPAWVVADDWNHAIEKWEAALESELDEDDRGGPIDPPKGCNIGPWVVIDSEGYLASWPNCEVME
jgi:hypothetical protein